MWRYSVERHRARRLLDSSLNQQVTGHRLAVGQSTGVTPLTRKQTSDDLLATVKTELNRSVKKHLETGKTLVHFIKLIKGF